MWILVIRDEKRVVPGDANAVTATEQAAMDSQDEKALKAAGELSDDQDRHFYCPGQEPSPQCLHSQRFGRRAHLHDHDSCPIILLCQSCVVLAAARLDD